MNWLPIWWTVVWSSRVVGLFSEVLISAFARKRDCLFMLRRIR